MYWTVNDQVHQISLLIYSTNKLCEVFVMSLLDQFFIVKYQKKKRRKDIVIRECNFLLFTRQNTRVRKMCTISTFIYAFVYIIFPYVQAYWMVQSTLQRKIVKVSSPFIFCSCTHPHPGCFVFLYQLYGFFCATRCFYVINFLVIK